jgi:hypothetical protein
MLPPGGRYWQLISHHCLPFLKPAVPLAHDKTISNIAVIYRHTLTLEEASSTVNYDSIFMTLAPVRWAAT